jgi:legumain
MKTYLKILSIICLFQIFSTKLFLSNLKGIDQNEEIHWAVLVAGSNSFWNYRHQSDVFHAYQTLIKKGLSPNNIILMAYDDIANSSENPIKGKVYNKPDPHGPGEDVYENIKIDYKGKDVNAKNFINIITGNKKDISGGNGRVLESKSSDNVFIYFSDHGSVGFVAFPNSELYADILNNALNKMNDQKMYKKLVFYLEACESGSMFENILRNDIRVYATTAANSNESSYATYCGPDDTVNGISIGSCLGDEYSVNWIENTEKTETNEDETLSQQYNIVKLKTTQSHVEHFGDLSFMNETINDFEGYENKKEDSFYKKIIKYLINEICKFREIIRLPCQDSENEKEKSYKKYLDSAKKSTIDSRKAKIDYLLKKSTSSNDFKYKEMLKNELEHMENSNKIFNDFNLMFNIDRNEIIGNINFDCLRDSIDSLKKCNEFGEYDLIFGRNIVLACKNHKSEYVVQYFKNLC